MAVHKTKSISDINNSRNKAYRVNQDLKERGAISSEEYNRRGAVIDNIANRYVSNILKLQGRKTALSGNHLSQNEQQYKRSQYMGINAG